MDHLHSIMMGMTHGELTGMCLRRGGESSSHEKSLASLHASPCLDCFFQHPPGSSVIVNDRDQSVKVVDYGIRRHGTPPPSSAVTPNMEPAYVRTGELTPRSDIYRCVLVCLVLLRLYLTPPSPARHYSLGVLMLECVTGLPAVRIAAASSADPDLARRVTRCILNPGSTY